MNSTYTPSPSLRKTLYLEFPIEKVDGTTLTAAVEVAPVSNILHSIFSNVQLLINREKVTRNYEQYPYKATTCGKDVIAAKILCEHNPYRIHNLTQNIETTPDWDAKEYKVLKDGAPMRIEQNPEFKHALLSHEGKTFIEATYN